MPGLRRMVLVVALSLSSCAVQVSAGAMESQPAEGVPGSFSLTVHSAGRGAEARRVAECPSGDPHGPPCIMSAYDPNPPGRLPIRCGGRLGLVTDAAAATVTVALQRPNRKQTAPVILASGPAEPVDESRTRWRFSLPCKIARVRAVAGEIAYLLPPDPSPIFPITAGSAAFDVGVRP